MVAVFFQLNVALDTQKIIIVNWCNEQCLPKIIECLRNLRPNSRLKLNEHHPFSSDFALCDIVLFSNEMKMKTKWKWFSSDADFLSAGDNECTIMSKAIWN